MDTGSRPWVFETSTVAEQVARFQTGAGYRYGYGRGHDPTLRVKLLRDETADLIAALEAGDLIQAMREAANVVVVCYGTAYFLGAPLDPVIDEVMQANLSRLGPHGEVELDADGKICKGRHYRPPDVAAVLAAHITTLP